MTNPQTTFGGGAGGGKTAAVQLDAEARLAMEYDVIALDISDPRFVEAITWKAEHSTRNRRQKAKIVTRAKVMKGAYDSYRAVGYAGTTSRGLAKAIGMSTGAIFSVFPDGLPQLWATVTGEPVPGSTPWTGPKPVRSPGDIAAAIDTRPGAVNWAL